MSTYKYADRVIFSPGGQASFFEHAHDKAVISWSAFARILGMSPRALLNYRKEIYTLPFGIFKKIIETTEVSIPKNIQIREQFWSNKTAGKQGGKAVFKKYGKVGGDEDNRRNQWKKWWDLHGAKNQNAILKRKTVYLPKRSAKLAELFGILIGDGGITKYQMTITLNGDADKMYSKFVVALLHSLFKIDPKIYSVKKSKAINIVISRSNLVDFLVHNGLKIGHKINQGVHIPDWIMKSKKYKISCLRGLVDTDGSVVLEKHAPKENRYTYPRLNFTSASPRLIQQVIMMLTELGFSPKIRRGGRSVQLENLAEICQYFEVIGSSNPKHLERGGAWYKKNK